MKLSREIKTAILVLTSILIFIWGYSFLKGKDLLSKYQNFYVIYDSVEGLSSSAAVTLNGLKVGKVNSIEIAPDGRLVVEVQVGADFPISKSSQLQMYEPGFIGGKQIALIPNVEDKTLAQNGDTLVGNIKQGMIAKVGDQIAPVQTKVENTLTSADSLLKNVNSLISQKNKENITLAIEELTYTLKNLNSATQAANAMLQSNQKNIDGIMRNLNKTSHNFAKISDSLAQANLKETITNLENTIGNINMMMNDIQAGKGTAGKLIKDEQLYNNLSGATQELKLLLEDLRLNPTRYINVSLFGKKNKPYKAPN